MAVSTTLSNTFSNSGTGSENKCTWVRPDDWLPMPTVLPSENKLVFLTAIFNTPNETIAFNNSLVGSTGVTVDWGDGTVTNYAQSGAKLERSYNYATLPESSYCSRGYKQVIITITPQSGNFNTGSFSLYSNQTNGIGTNFSTQFLDVIVSTTTSGNLGYNSAKHPYLERFVQLSGTISPIFFFQDYIALRYLSPIKISGGACTFMFNNAYVLEYIPEISVVSTITGTSYMFSNMSSLRYPCPRLDLSSVTDISFMHSNNYNLEFIPNYNLGSSITTANSFAVNCWRLKRVACSFNLPVCVTTNAMFQNNYALSEPPSITTGNSLIAIGAMFQNAISIKKFNLFNTSFVTNANNFMNGCISITEIPPFDFQRCTNFNATFQGCVRVPSIYPTFNCSAASGGISAGLYGTFDAMRSLNELPAFAIPTTVTSLQSTFPTNTNLKSMKMTGMRTSFSVAQNPMIQSELESMFDNILPAISQSVTITSCVGAPTAITKTALTTTAGSKTINIPTTSGLEVGMCLIGIGTSLTTPIAVTTTDATDTVNLNAHGLSDGTEVAFSSIVSTTGIAIGTIYYVVNATTNTFQLAATSGGPVLPLFTNGTGFIRYKCVITAITPNTNITISTPCTSTATSTLTFRQLAVWKVLMKNWTVTG
jgi:hypothetical protein